jgi:uncharacterized membrane protein
MLHHQPHFKEIVMNKNVGSIDRILRLLAAIVIFVLIYTDTLTGTLAWVFGGASLIFAITGLLSWCPLYTVFGTSTRKAQA